MIAASPSVRATDDEIQSALSRFSCEEHAGDVASRVFFPGILDRAMAAIVAYQANQPLMRFCYSVKTNPAASVVEAAKRAGLLAEVISPQELQHAMRCGFAPAEVVYNGPYPAHCCAQAPAYVFADSIEAYIGAVRRFPATLIGIRLRPPGISSHFGLSRQKLEEFVQTVRDCGRAELGMSFHVRPQDYQSYDFRTLTQAAVEFAQEVERRSCAKVVAFDVGGGKNPAEFDDAIRRGDFQWLQRQVAETLPSVASILIEPGQALVTGCEAVISHILEVRRRGADIKEVIVDAGYPALPQIAAFPHRIFLLARSEPRRVGFGDGRILGRTCLEYDILARDVDLAGCHTGDAIVFADAGAYDASMSFDFGRGRRCP